MVINAEGFTLWTEHFKRLEEVVPAWPESALLTISRFLSMTGSSMILKLALSWKKT